VLAFRYAGSMPAADFPDGFFDRVDRTDDAHFYAQPRFVTHIDDATIAALTNTYREVLPPAGAVLDLMSSWISHLPDGAGFERVAGLGMNAAELERNAQLSEWCVHDLNRNPELPYEDASFDAVVNSVSIQYLTKPVEVFRSVARVLRSGGLHLIATSHRLFPTKAVRAWHVLAPEQRFELIRTYFERAGGYEAVCFEDRSPKGADPLWILQARRSRAG
jgi:SAM-dependent methyltransferase